MNLTEKLQNLSHSPGVYQMLDKHAEVIYVGKAKNLKKRVSSYFSKTHTDGKTKALVANIQDFKIIVTETETQALLLENELIKQHKPRYNVLLKDAKSYPYIFISNDQHPRAGLYRGNKNKQFQYFGPYPSAQVVRNSLSLLKKIFKVRQCTNGVYRSRSRACLEHQIDLCSAPCVGKISDQDYAQDVEMMRLFLSGQAVDVLEHVSEKMQAASEALDFELAAKYRDQLIELRSIQEQHGSSAMGDMDVVAIAKQDHVFGVEVVFVRGGRQVAQEFILPKNAKHSSESEVLSAFLPLYYLGKQLPKRIALSHKIEDKALIASALGVQITDTIRAEQKHFIKMATLNAKENLHQHLISKFTKFGQLQRLQQLLDLDSLPNWLECFDISHSSGEATTASCVVFEQGKPKKSRYRFFNIDGITPGDDYAAMNQAVYRRYSRLLKEDQGLPDLVFIDGGLGQLNQAQMVMDSIGIDEIQLIGIAKGEGRKAGLETLILKDGESVRKINLAINDLALLLINHIRDESHRFALKHHRKKRDKKRRQSTLEAIPGIGKMKRLALLNHFGGLQEVEKASREEIAKVEGISLALADKIIENLTS